MASPKGVEGGFVLDVPGIMQIFQAFVVGCFGKYFTDSHYFVSSNANRILKPVEVPGLKKCHVKAYMGGVEVCVVDYFVEETGEVFDVVHFFMSC